MTSLSVTGALREAGVTFEVRDGRLRVAPAARLTPELVALVREHKEQLARIARFRENVDKAERGRENHVPARESGPPIEDAAAALELARANLNPSGIDYGPPPPPKVAPGRDPMVKRDTEKARFYRGVRERDLEKRRREGLPAWIRLVDGGAA